MKNHLVYSLLSGRLVIRFYALKINLLALKASLKARGGEKQSRVFESIAQQVQALSPKNRNVVAEIIRFTHQSVQIEKNLHPRLNIFQIFNKLLLFIPTKPSFCANAAITQIDQSNSKHHPNDMLQPNYMQQLVLQLQDWMHLFKIDVSIKH